VDLLGYRVASADADGCARSIMAWIDGATSCRWLACLNPHSYVVATDDQRFSTALRDADWLLADGAGIVLASRLLHSDIHERVTGSDVFWRVNQALDRRGGSVFFLGSTEATLELIRRRMEKDFPRVRIAGMYSPPFKQRFSAADDDAMIAAINAARPDVLWVGMTAPKQELWLHENAARLDAKFAAGIGAVFDFYSGRVKRSHPLFQRCGLEWLPRLVQQPRRLWRRTFISAPVFLWHTVRHAARLA
jgi:N-acetylglucosaminyldiphosphoundecaprenol N-acetyl-beta-D-mannosaminyltransferase